MSKNKVIIVLLMLLSIGIVSLYTTFAYQDNDFMNEQSDADYNFIYSLKDSSNKEISVNANEEKFVDIYLKNTYESTIKYGMYYYVISPNKLPDNVSITLVEESRDLLEDIIKPQQDRIVSIKIVNNSEYTINVIIGALIGFENGNIEDLVSDGEVLIK